MWRLITILTIVLASANAAGQGKIQFANDSNRLFVLGYPWPQDPIGPIPTSPLPSGLSLVAVLYAGTSAGILSLQTSVVLSGANWLSPGRMAGKNVTLSNVAGGSPAYFQVFVMDTGATQPNTIPGGAGGPYFVGATYFGTSGLFTAVPGTSIAFPNLATGASSTWPVVPLDAAGCLECVPPWFLINPSNSVVNLGDDVTLNAMADDYVAPPFSSISYQWRKQFVPITGATNNYLTLTNVSLAAAANYDVMASNEYGSSPSAVATLRVLVPAVLGSLTYTPQNQFQFTVTGAPGTNYVVQVSTNLLTGQWVSVATNASPFIFVDSNAQNFPERFYRVYSP